VGECGGSYMDEQKSHISVSQGFEVHKPQKGKAYIIPVQEWDQIKQRIGRIESIGLGFHTAGSLLLGVAGTAIVAALGMPSGTTVLNIPSIQICWAIGLVSGICGGMALYFASRQRNIMSYSKQDVISDMEHIEKRFGKVDPS
jgi:hypothetical protein